MQCPKCHSRIPRGSPVCFKCGTKMTQIQEASFKAVKQARAEYDYDKIVLSSAFPKDLSYVKTLLMCIFLGLFGGHYFYTKRYTPAIIYLSCSSLFLVFILISGIQTGFNAGMFYYFSSEIMNFLFIVSCICGAVVFLLWITDIIKIATKNFKVPVVLKEK